MKKLSLLLLMLGAAAQAQSPSTKNIPSSDVPERRSFPLDEDKNPCDDFHDYVCSKVEASFKLRDDRSKHVFSFSDSDERLLLKKRAFFKNIHKEKKLSPRGQDLKKNYLACMDAASQVKSEKKWLKKEKTDIYAHTSIESFRDSQLSRLEQGLVSYYEVGEAENVDDPLIYDLYLNTDLMSLPDHSYYKNPELMAARRDIMIDFFKIAEPKTSPEMIEKRVEAMTQLETEFVKAYPTNEVRRQRWAEKRDLTKEEFLEKYSKLGLADWINKKIPANTKIRVLFPEALDFFQNQLNQQKLGALQDFLFFQIGSSIMDEAYPSFFQKLFDFRNKFFGAPKTRPVREERCTLRVMGNFAKELDEILLPRVFPNFPEQKFRNVADKIRASIVKGIEANRWLSAEAKKEALTKMSTARLQLVKPQNEQEWDFNPRAKYSATDLIGNAVALSEARYKKSLQALAKPVDINTWGMGPLIVNAYYDPTKNKFVMPVGILQYPFFDPSGDLIENLGSVGAVIGHELGHGIDDMGSKYDHNGSLKQWMSMDDLAEFSKRTSRLVDQYNKIGHNGKLTLGENVADLVGVTFGYNAAFPDPDSVSAEDKKKYFVSFARLWCGVMRPEMREKLLKTDPHSLGFARINEPIKHLKGFSEAFQCKEGDKMYLPEGERIQIW